MKNYSGSNRRKEPRYIVDNLRVTEQGGISLIGKLRDISESGLMILSEEVLCTGEELLVWVELPEDPGFSSGYMEMTMVLLWSRIDEDPKLYAHGGNIINLSETARQDVQLMMKKFGLEETF